MSLPSVTSLSPSLGAEITNIDLSVEMNPESWKIVEEAFNNHSVLVFRNQHLSVEDFKRFGLYFGELFIHEHLKAFTLENHPECMVLHNNDKKPPGLNYWHTDNSGWETPPLGTILYSKITPTVGGDTLFSNMYEAFNSLSNFMQDFLKPLKAVHDVKKAFGSEYRNLQSVLKNKGIDPAQHFAQYPPVMHPVLRTHPATKKLALYISEPYVTHIEGLSTKESKAILEFLFRHIETQEFIYRHRWQTNDVVIWDNRSVQHYAVADYFPQERLMHRLNVCGDKPY